MKGRRNSILVGDNSNRFDLSLVDRHKLNEQIAEIFQKEIAEGNLKPGDKLPPERTLAELLKVNRHTVREAIHLLHERGFVERKNGRGTRVVSVLPDNVAAAIDRFFVSNNCTHRELFEFRGILEPKIAALAAMNATPEQIRQLRSVLANLEDAWEAKDPLRLADADAKFHLTLAVASHNTLMLAVTSGLNAVLKRFLEMGHANSHSEESFQTHRIIYRAIVQHDPVKAERAMQQQLIKGEQELQKDSQPIQARK